MPTFAPRKSTRCSKVTSVNAMPPSKCASGRDSLPWKVAPENNVVLRTCSLRNSVMP